MRLLIFKVNQLGDNVVFLPVVQELARRHPDWQITVCTSSVAAPLYQVTCTKVKVLEFQTQSFNEAWRHPFQLWQLIRQFHRLPQDACLLGNDQGNVAHLLARSTGAPRIIGPRIEERHLGWLLHERVPLDFSEADPRQNWRIAQTLAPDMPAAIPAPDLAAFGCTEHGGVFIHAGASREYKKWPLEDYVTLANRLSTTLPVTWMLQNDPREQRLCSGVHRLQQGTLAELIRGIAGSRLFIGNNSGPMNVASALGIPGIIFNGPSTTAWDPFWHHERFEILRDPNLACQPCDLPNRPMNFCRNTLEPMACMKRWSVDHVHELVMARMR